MGPPSRNPGGSALNDLRGMCAGVPPLRGRLERWHREIAGDPANLSALIEKHGSPVNLISPEPLGRNAAELQEAAADRDVPFRIFFARKANKALSLVDEAKRLGLGVDVASERELRQVLDRGVEPADVIVTAAVKPRTMLALCIEKGTPVAVDNLDELGLIRSVAKEGGHTAQIAVRLSPVLPASKTPTRFGMTQAEILAALDPTDATLALRGVHFHLDGYDAGDRVAAIAESLGLIDELRQRGFQPDFLDIGGGVPMSYLESRQEWDEFWDAKEAMEEGRGREITFDGHLLGKVYPYHQVSVRGDWLGQILDAALHTGTVAEAIRARGLELRCEPGRSLLDGCGMTVARVEFRKQRADGTWLIGLAMNRTQMRSTSDDYLVDPLLIRPVDAGEPSEALEAYLVGAYCIERELLSWRRFFFPKGVAVGDLVAFVNTAGYVMHILESASHQIPLARNLAFAGGRADLDPIEFE
jgi:diaminopimelate decarboxylase